MHIKQHWFAPLQSIYYRHPSFSGQRLAVVVLQAFCLAWLPSCRAFDVGIWLDGMVCFIPEPVREMVGQIDSNLNFIKEWTSKVLKCNHCLFWQWCWRWLMLSQSRLFCKKVRMFPMFFTSNKYMFQPRLAFRKALEVTKMSALKSWYIQAGRSRIDPVVLADQTMALWTEWTWDLSQFDSQFLSIRHLPETCNN